MIINNKDRREVIEKENYTKIFFDILKNESNRDFWKDIKEDYENIDEKNKAKEERRKEQKNMYAKRKELTTLNFIKKEKEYSIDYEGIIQYIFTNICDLPLNKPVRYDDLIIILKDYLKEISQIDLSKYSINNILKGFLIGHDLRRNQELTQMETRIPLIGLTKTVDYEPEPSREGLTPIKDIHDAHERNKANIHFYRCSSKFVHEIPHIQNKLSNISKKIWDKYNIIA